MKSSRGRSACLVAALLVAGSPAAAIVAGQLDDFQDGTTQGWTSGIANPNPPINAADAGPAGAGDHALQITSNGIAGPGSNFLAFNTEQWSGDYLGAGVETIVLDVDNVGETTLQLRLALLGAGGPFVTSPAVAIAAGSGWQTVALSVAPGDLVPVGGSDVTATLGGVDELRLLSAVSPAFMGDTIVAQGLFDNVVALPEPPGEVGVAAGLGLLALLAASGRGGR